MKKPPHKNQFAKLKKLKVLTWLEHNNASKNIPADIFRHQTQLEKLDIKLDNPPCGLLSPLKNLKKLNMENSNLSGIGLCENFFEGRVKLEELNMESCELITLPTMDKMVNLKWLK